MLPPKQTKLYTHSGYYTWRLVCLAGNEIWNLVFNAIMIILSHNNCVFSLTQSPALTARTRSLATGEVWLGR